MWQRRREKEREPWTGQFWAGHDQSDRQCKWPTWQQSCGWVLSKHVFAKCAVGMLQVTRGLNVCNILDPYWQWTHLHESGEAFSWYLLKGNWGVFTLCFWISLSHYSIRSNKETVLFCSWRNLKTACMTHATMIALLYFITEYFKRNKRRWVTLYSVNTRLQRHSWGREELRELLFHLLERVY